MSAIAKKFAERFDFSLIRNKFAKQFDFSLIRNKFAKQFDFSLIRKKFAKQFNFSKKVHDNVSARVHVLWDIENLWLSNEMTNVARQISEIKEQLKNAVKSETHDIRVTVYMDPTKVTDTTRKYLNHSGVKVVDICVQKKEMADRLLESDARNVINDAVTFGTQKKTTLVVISLDKDFVSILGKAKDSGLSNVILLTPLMKTTTTSMQNLETFACNTTQILFLTQLKQGNPYKKIKSSMKTKCKISNVEHLKKCSLCDCAMPSSFYSIRQWNKNAKTRKCKTCV